MIFNFLAEVANSCDFYKDGFFGYGEKGDFKYFSFWHFLPIIILIAAIILTYIYREKIRNFKYEKAVRVAIAIVMLIFEMGYFWRLLYAGSGDSEKHTLLTKLPFQVCEWTCIFAAIMMLAEIKTLFDIDVFVCLTLGIIPLVMPGVISTTGPRYFRYYQFFIEHGMPIYSVFYMMFVKEYKFEARSVYKPAIFLVVLAIIAIIFNNLIPGASFLYLAGTTDGKTVLNYLPDNIGIRVLIFSAIVALIFTIEILVFKLVEKIKKKKAGAAS